MFSGCRGEPSPALPSPAYAELAGLTSAYSAHAGTRTVTFRDGQLRVRRQDACRDSRLDTYEDNGPVAKAYAALLSAILRNAAAITDTEESGAFLALALLYRHLCTLREDACNQENAASLAEQLLAMAPVASGVCEAGRVRAPERKGDRRHEGRARGGHRDEH